MISFQHTALLGLGIVVAWLFLTEPTPQPSYYSTYATGPYIPKPGGYPRTRGGPGNAFRADSYGPNDNINGPYQPAPGNYASRTEFRMDAAGPSGPESYPYRGEFRLDNVYEIDEFGPDAVRKKLKKASFGPMGLDKSAWQRIG